MTLHLTAQPRDRSRWWKLGCGWALLFSIVVIASVAAQAFQNATITKLTDTVQVLRAQLGDRDPPCTQGMTLQPGQSCTMRLPLFSRSGERT